MTNWLDVCVVDDLVPNAGICALVEQKQIAIFSMPKIDGLFAIDNFDPFSGANVLSRGMVGDLGGEPMVASPMYKVRLYPYHLQKPSCLRHPVIF